MTLSVMTLERPGRWRMAGLATVILSSVLPAFPLIKGIFHAESLELFRKLGDFPVLLLKSIFISFSGAVIALVLGLLAGVMHALYHYRARQAILFLFMLPVIVPPLLWSVSFNNLAGMTGLAFTAFYSQTALVLITVMITFPMVVVATLSACTGLKSSQCDAVRLDGGEGRLVLLAARFCLSPAAMAACLGAFLTLSSPGAAMGLGTRTAISEIILSFSALYNMKLAAFQCMLLALSTIALAIAILWFTGKRPIELLSGALKGLEPVLHKKMSARAFLFNGLCCLFLVLMPIAGLLLPALTPPDYGILVHTISRTMGPTLLYSLGAAAIATAAGTGAAICMGRFAGMRVTGLGAMLVIFSLPASLTALGFVYAGSQAPGWADFIFRSPLAVCLAQGLRLFPVPALLAARFISSIPSSWSHAAEIQGVSLLLFARRIIAPLASRTVLAGFMLAFLLSEADVGTVLLLHPPGAQNLPLAIFTIMANAPRSTVSQLCLLYLLSASIFLLLLTRTWNMGQTRKTGSPA